MPMLPGSYPGQDPVERSSPEPAKDSKTQISDSKPHSGPADSSMGQQKSTLDGVNGRRTRESNAVERRPGDLSRPVKRRSPSAERRDERPTTRRRTSPPPEHSSRGPDLESPSDIESLREELSESQNNVNQLELALNKKERKYRHALKQFDNERLDLEAKLRACQDELKAQQQESSKELEDCRQLLQIRTGELKAAEAFLTVQDQFTPVDVRKIVETLNNEIMQLAALMSETFLSETEPSLLGNPSSSSQSRLSDEGFLLFTEAVKTIGHPRMMHWLRTQRADDLFPTILQCAIQAALISSTAGVICNWRLAGAHTIHKLLQKNELVSVVGQWRSLSRRTIDAHMNREDWLADALAKLINPIATILTISGSAIEGEEIPDAIQAQFGGKLEQLLFIVEKLRSARTQVISQDLLPFIARPGDQYNTERMLDEFEDPRAEPSKGVVFCTTQMGLESFVRGKTLDNKVVNERSICLQAKVLLSTALDIQPKQGKGGQK